MRVEFHPQALTEFEEAAHHYATCREGLDVRFINAIERAVQQVAETPEAFRVF